MNAVNLGRFRLVDRSDVSSIDEEECRRNETQTFVYEARSRRLITPRRGVKH